MESAQVQQAKYADLRRRELTFQVGGKLLSTQNLAVDPRNTRKLTPKWTRPFMLIFLQKFRQVLASLSLVKHNELIYINEGNELVFICEPSNTLVIGPELRIQSFG
jgi:hypothetical protein